MRKNTLVFVYGTLKRGHGNHHLLARSAFRTLATTFDRYDMLQVGFPVVLPGNTGFVCGEVYRVDALTLARLDRLEGEGYMYKRAVVDLADPDDRPLRAWMYIGVPRFWDCRGESEVAANDDGMLIWNGYATLLKARSYTDEDDYAGPVAASA